MDFENQSPEWNAKGTEPPASLKTNGFEPGYKPPAAYFNWFWHRVSACLKELQEKVKQIRTVSDGGTGKSSVTSGNYLVGNGSGTLNEKTPLEVREHIEAAPKNAAIPTVKATSTDGEAYAATVDGVDELYNGMILTIIPDKVSASTAITLNVNNTGPKMVRLPLSFNNAAMSIPRLETYFTEGRPITLQYDANYAAGGVWKTLGKQRTSAQDLYGIVPIESGGTGSETAEAARTALGITPANIGAAEKTHGHSGSEISTGGSQGQILTVDENGKIVPNELTIAELGTGAVYELSGTTLYINTL